MVVPSRRPLPEGHTAQLVPLQPLAGIGAQNGGGGVHV